MACAQGAQLPLRHPEPKARDLLPVAIGVQACAFCAQLPLRHPEPKARDLLLVKQIPHPLRGFGMTREWWYRSPPCLPPCCHPEPQVRDLLRALLQ